jgi:hypothetical protein
MQIGHGLSRELSLMVSATAKMASTCRPSPAGHGPPLRLVRPDVPRSPATQPAILDQAMIAEDQSWPSALDAPVREGR